MSIRQGNNLIAGTPDVTGKADTDLSNLTSTGKSYGASLALPSDSYIDWAIGAAGSQYTAPANGWVTLNAILQTGGWIALISSTKLSAASVHYGGDYIYVPVKTGDVVSLEYGGGITSWDVFRFVYAEGEI